MSAPVALDELAERIDALGSAAFLVTTDGSSPHIVSVVVDFDGETCTLTVGSTSRGNVEATGRASLLWPDAVDYGLIVDGDADVGADPGTVRLRPTRAVLHRLAGASPELPGCIRLEA